MAKNLFRSNLKLSEEEDRVFNLIKSQPDISNKFINSINRKKQHYNYEKVATDFNCSVDVIKKIVSKIQSIDEMKKEFLENRIRSKRSSLIEPRETRRSLRSQSAEKLNWIISTIGLENLDTNNVSGRCVSPKLENFHPSESSKNLDSIAEVETKLYVNGTEDLPVKDKPTEEMTQQNSAGEIDEENTKAEDCNTSNQDDGKTSDIRCNDYSQVTLNGDTHDEVDQAIHTSDVKYYDTTPNGETRKSRSLRFGKSVQILRNNQSPHSALNNNSRRLSGSGSKGVRHSNNKNSLIMDDSTRMFFDSISLTVMNFPQHLQASVKAQVSKIVHELEYDFSLPNSLANNCIT